MLLEAVTPDGEAHSLLLQNAETVRLVGPSEAALVPRGQLLGAVAAGNQTTEESWQAVSVSELKIGQPVFVRRQGAARHTGICIDEFIVER